MARITNTTAIDLPLAVWLLQDGYDSGKENAPPGELISVTSLIRPTKQQILQRRVDYSKETTDVSDLIASRIGHAFHDSIERAWTTGDWRKALQTIGYPNHIIDRIRINPDPDKLSSTDIPIYLEQRRYREHQGLVITGQMDFIINGAYRDFKSTSTFAYTSGSKDKDYILQGSLYRWIAPDLITNDVMRIDFIFTDWASYRVKSNPNYPQKRIVHKEFKLMSLDETETWVNNKIADIKVNATLPQFSMVDCTDKELWRSADTYKYYSDPKTHKTGGRCTKRFTDEGDAILHKNNKMKGIVVKDPGEVKACTYCPAFTICEQRKRYFADNGNSIQ